MQIDLSIAVSMGVFFASLVSLYFTRRFWLQSNRPIVTAFIDENTAGNMASTFNLVVSNTGNRPAVNVRLHAEEREVSVLHGEGVNEQMAEEMRRCFAKESTIAVLRNGEDLFTAFGSYGVEISSRQLSYGVQIPIVVTYDDLDGRKYRGRMPLKAFVRLDGRKYRGRMPLKAFVRNGFGGAVWDKPKSSSRKTSQT